MTEDFERTPRPEQQKEQRIISGSPREVVSTLVKERIGIGLFTPEDVSKIEQALAEEGFTTAAGAPGTSTVAAGEKEKLGSLHRHGDDGIIVHQTSEGEGKANFYWPVADRQGYSPDFYFDPEVDEVAASATGIKIAPDVVVLFPTNTWHQFGAAPHSHRVSTFRTFVQTHE